MGHGYQTELCSCLADCSVCLTVVCCGWTGIPSACNWAGSKRQNCNPFHCCLLPHPIWTRDNIRGLNGVHESQHCMDCCLYCFCCPLATCQDTSELKCIEKRGLGTVDSLNSEASMSSYAGAPPSRTMIQPMIVQPVQPNGASMYYGSPGYTDGGMPSSPYGGSGTH